MSIDRHHHVVIGRFSFRLNLFRWELGLKHYNGSQSGKRICSVFWLGPLSVGWMVWP